MSYSPNTPIVSTSNSTSSTLLSGATFTGVAELAPRGELIVMSKSDVAGTLYFDFSTDGTNWDSTFPSAGYSCAAGIPEVHRAVVGGRYFRVRYVNGGTGQGYFRLQTSFSNTGPLSAPIGFNIADDADAIVTKSVISGIGNTTATVTDHQALQVTPAPEGKTSFGEQLVGQLEPVIGLTFVYPTVNRLLITPQENQSGTVTIATSMLTLQTGAAANSSATMVSNQKIKYEPGIGIRARFTGLFTTGVANSTQIIGIGDSGEGFFFGYNGTSFGIMRRYGGNPEVRVLTVSAGANDGTGTDDVTITLDGDAKTVTLTDFSGATTITANEIAAADYSDVGRGWTARAVGPKVIFTSWDSAAHSGTFSFADTDSTGAAASFSTSLTGVAPTDSWVAQASWNGVDIFDGNGLTGTTLDPTKGNVYQIDFQYLGFGVVRFYIEDPDDGELHLVHAIEYANAYTRPSLDNPSMPLYASAENTSNTSNITLKSASMAAFIDGARRNLGINRGIRHDKTISSSGEYPILSLRLKEVYSSSINRSKMKINLVGASCEHTKPVFITFYANAKLTGASFTDLDSNGYSSVERDTSATAIDTTNAVFLFSIPLGKAGQTIVNLLQDLNIGEFGAGDVLTIAGKYNSGTNAEVSVSLNFTEKL